MNSIPMPLIQTIRKFNRFYTNILGLLDQHILNSEFSLAEVRVLYDIAHVENCTAKKLTEELRMDRGYLSRVLKRFERSSLIYRVQAPEDGRLYYLYLTEQGKDTLLKLEDLSNRQIEQMIGCLPEKDLERIAESMQTMEKALTGEPESLEEKITIRCDLRPGDVGSLIHLHGWIYAEECGYNHEFEGYVCKTFYDFFENYSSDKDRFWFAEENGKMMGAIAIVGHSAERAQLRWFILHPAIRGIGLGKTLLNKAMKYCKEKGYRQVFLATTAEQITAIAMYRKIGFRLVSEHSCSMWGKELTEQMYEINILPE